MNMMAKWPSSNSSLSIHEDRVMATQLPPPLAQEIHNGLGMIDIVSEDVGESRAAPLTSKTVID
jgi:hypothetical protein